MNNTLFYKSPADPNPRNKESWNEALPIGNGAIGAMVFGGIDKERIQLNEDTLWYGGGGRNRVNPDAKDNYKKIRELLKEGRIKEAQKLGKLSMVAGPDCERIYSTAGNMMLDFEEKAETATDYVRSLDMAEAIAKVKYTIDGTIFEREAFCSEPDNVFAMRATADKEKKLHYIVSLNREKELDENKATATNEISMTGIMGGKGGVSFCVTVRVVQTDGKVYTLGNNILLEEATEAVLLVAIRTSFYGDNPEEWCKKVLDKAEAKSYAELKSSHIEDYRKLYDRVSFSLGTEEQEKELCALPTNERLARVQNGETDLGLIVQYFYFGRYLLIASSREGTQPANLQGIWNHSFNPPWGSKYTININTEMNYWLAENCNLSECHLPLFDLLKRMLPNGQQVAKDMYGCRGFVAHHNTDLYGDCAPQDIYMPATIWPMGAAWLCTHIWERYSYTLDKEFLADNYELLKETATFFLDYMFIDDKGQLVTGPSVSPENTYIHPSGEKGTLCNGPSMDSQIIIDIFNACLKSSEILGNETADIAEMNENIREALKKIPKPAIGKYGQVMEWEHDYEESNLGHRHISHLYALHPSNQINDKDTPELMKAARVTLERRLAHGGGHTGWSRAWIINMWARLKDGEKVFENVQALLQKSTSINLFDMHPPFQIDGNFGGTAGIAEALMQSHAGVIELLPALPKEWSIGSIKGLKARGNIELDFSWKDGKVTECTLRSLKGSDIYVQLPGSNEVKSFTGGGGAFEVQLPIE